MDLKKNAFWVALGALAAVAGGLYVALVVFGVNAQIAAKKTDLDKKVRALRGFASIKPEEVSDPVKGLPIEAVVAYWESKRESLAREAARVEDLYRARDRAFERVFGAGRDGTVALAQFAAQLDDAIERDLKKEFADLFEEPFEKAIVFGRPQRDEEISFAQKKFYIVKAILEALKEAGAHSVSSIEVRDPNLSSGYGATEKKDESASKDVQRIDVSVVARMRAPGIPTLVAKLLQSQVVFEVRELSATGVPFAYPELDPWKVFEGQGGANPPGPWASFPRDVFIGLQDSADAKSKNPPPEIKEPPIQVKLALDALDFNLPEKAK